MNEVKSVDIPREHSQEIKGNKNRVTNGRTLILQCPYEKDGRLVTSLKKQLRRSQPKIVKANIVFTRTKCSTNFNIKDPVSFTDKHDVIYRSVCATGNCNEDYVVECARRLYERENHHNGCNN